MKFPEKLVKDYIDLMEEKYGVKRTEEEAEMDLDSLGDMFLILANKDKEET